MRPTRKAAAKNFKPPPSPDYGSDVDFTYLEKRRLSQFDESSDSENNYVPEDEKMEDEDVSEDYEKDMSEVYERDMPADTVMEEGEEEADSHVEAETGEEEDALGKANPKASKKRKVCGPNAELWCLNSSQSVRACRAYVSHAGHIHLACGAYFSHAGHISRMRDINVLHAGRPPRMRDIHVSQAGGFMDITLKQNKIS